MISLFIEAQLGGLHGLFLRSLNFWEWYIFHPIRSYSDLRSLDLRDSITVHQQTSNSSSSSPHSQQIASFTIPNLWKYPLTSRDPVNNLTLLAKSSANVGLSLAKIPVFPWLVSFLSLKYFRFYTSFLVEFGNKTNTLGLVRWVALQNVLFTRFSMYGEKLYNERTHVQYSNNLILI